MPVDTAGGVQGITLDTSAKRAYVAEGAAGVQVFDIATPGAPVAMGRVRTPGFARQVAVPVDANTGQCLQVNNRCYVYVADGGDGLVVVDATSPSAPTLAGAVPTQSQARGVFVSAADTLAYVADYAGGLEVFDISDPLKPRLNATVPMKWSVTTSTPMVIHHGLAEAVVVQVNATNPTQTLAYLAAGAEGLQIIDVSTAATPSPMLSSIVLGSDVTDKARGVAVSGQYAYVADGFGLKAVNLSSPTSQNGVTTVPMPDLALGVTIAGNSGKTYAYVPDRYRGLQIVDITTPPPAAGTVPAGVDTPGIAANVDIVTDNNGDCISVNHRCYAYVADMQGGLQVVDVTSPDAPFIAATVPAAATAIPPADGQLLRPARSVRVVQADALTYYAFVVAGINGLQVIEVDYKSGSPEAHLVAAEPLPLSGAIQVLGAANDIAIARDAGGGCKLVNNAHCYAYVADGKFGLEVFDVYRNLVAEASADSDTQDRGVIPNPIAVKQIPGAATGVALSADGKFAYVTNDNGVEAFDLSHPDAPVDVGGVNIPNHAQGIAVAGQKLYVADGNGGLATIPSAVYSATTYSPSSGNLSVIADNTNLPVGTYDVILVNADGSLSPRARNALKLTTSVVSAGFAPQGSSPTGASQPAATAQSSGGGKLLATGPGGQASVGEARSPSQVDMGSSSPAGGGGGGGALGAGFMALLLTGLWARARRRA